MELLWTAMKNNLHSVLFTQIKVIILSLLHGLSYFPQKITNGFRKTLYLPLEKLKKKKKKARFRLKGTELTGFHQYLTWEKLC